MPKRRRTKFRKNYQDRVRKDDLTRRFTGGADETIADEVRGERLSGKGELTRHRTLAGPDATDLRRGDVLSMNGLRCRVLADDGVEYECAVRQVLKSLAIEGRGTVVAGDRVGFRAESTIDGMIETVEDRRGVVSRTSRGQQHVIAANVDCLLIIASVANPGLKPQLIDRYLLTAGQCDIEAVVVLNKCDLVDPVTLVPIIGAYARLGVRVLPVSAETGMNVDYLRPFLQGRRTVLSGQSGVGKSSLLNAIDPSLDLATGFVSEDNNKGRHTTTAARMIPLSGGGAVFDTPGIRQFELWDIEPVEIAGLMPDFRPHVDRCRFPDCRHLGEDDCAIKTAVAEGTIVDRRYDAYCYLIEDAQT